MKKLALVLALFCSSVNAESFGDAIKSLPKEEWVWQSLHIIDTAQTIQISRNPDKYVEKNPILGKHPSTTSVIVWSVATSVIHGGIIYGLEKVDAPNWFIKTVEYISIAEKGNAVYTNFKIGL
jgi:hypothetical protein